MTVATRTKKPPILTIGMAAYDDPAGVYFTIQALRLYHPEVADRIEIIVIDNNPEGPYAEEMKHVCGKTNVRLIPYKDKKTTSCRNLVFQHARGTYVLCIDSHVFLAPGSLARLLEYFELNPDTKDLLQGPMLYDSLSNKGVGTHWDPKWQAGMFGVWGHDPRGENPNSEPFDIPLLGLGLFCCRKDAWLGFHSLFRGFGGEEGYIHEKFRRAGRRCLCLPFLRWMHRFRFEKSPAPYSRKVDDIIYNYFVGWLDNEQDIEPIIQHFSQTFKPDRVMRILDQARRDLGNFKPPEKYTVTEMMDMAQELAAVIVSLPPGQKRQALSELQSQNEACYALVKYNLDKMSGEAAA